MFFSTKKYLQGQSVKQEADLTIITAEKKIEEAKQLLARIDDRDKAFFLEILAQRVHDFESAFTKNSGDADLDPIIWQYNHFATTLFNVLHRPKSAHYYIGKYFNMSYYPVGIDDAVKHEPVRYTISLTGTILGAALILASFFAFAFNPLIAIVFLPLGISLLAPSCASLLTPDSPDTSEKKREETLIFQEGAQLIDPTVTFMEHCDYQGSMYARLI